MFTAGPDHPPSIQQLRHRFALFTKSGVKVVFSGHEHNFQAGEAGDGTGGIRFLVSGAGGELRRGNVQTNMKNAHIQAWAEQNHFLEVGIDGKTMRVTLLSYEPLHVVASDRSAVPLPFTVTLPSNTTEPDVLSHGRSEPRPRGAVVQLDFAMEHFNWDSVPLEIMSDLISRKIISGEKAMIAQIFIKKGGVVPEHHHESEQVTYVLEGALKFELEGTEVVVRTGEVLRIPSYVPHRAVALEDTIDLDVFSPIRKDWLTKDDAYLRRGEREAT